MRAIMSGGAPLSPSTHNYLRAVLGVDLLQVLDSCSSITRLSILQGYGLTETCACGSITSFEELSVGTVGPPVQAVQLKLVNWEEGNYKVTDKPNPR